MKILANIKKLEWPFISIREHNNILARANRVSNAHFVKIQEHELTIRNLTEEIRLSKPKRDAKGRFSK